MAKNLTDAIINNLPSAGKAPNEDKAQYIVRDAKQHGLFLVIGKRTRTWAVQLDYLDMARKRKTKRIVLGHHPALPVAKARIEAMETLARHKKAPGAQAEPVTLRMAWAEYQKRMATRIARGDKSQASLTSYRDRLEGRLGDWLDVSLADLSNDPMAVHARHQEIGMTSGHATADCVMKTLRTIYKFTKAINRDAKLPSDMPTSAVAWFLDTPNRPAMREEDFPEWHRQLMALENPVRQAYHKMMLYSGMRPASLGVARWADLDRDRCALRVPLPKGGKRKAFELPLSDAMLTVLDEAQEAGRLMAPSHCGEFIFPSPTNQGHVTSAVEPKLSYWGASLRRTVKGIHITVGIADMFSQLLLNHGPRNVSEGYARPEALHTPLVKAQNDVSNYIDDRLVIS